MKYDHVVKYNGIYYQPGQEVPAETSDTEVDTKDEKPRRGRKPKQG